MNLLALVLIIIFGFIVGFVSGVFPGPITLIIISLSLRKGNKTALKCLLAQILVELIYASLAFAGIGNQLKYLSPYSSYFHFGAALFVFIYGLKLTKNPKINLAKEKSQLLVSNPQFQGPTLGLSLGLTNPGIVFFFMGTYQLFITTIQSSHSAILFFSMMAGLELGVLSWYLLVFSWAKKWQEKLNQHLEPIHKIMGQLLLLMGVVLTAKAIYEILSS